VHPVDVAAVKAGARVVNIAFEDEQMKLDKQARRNGALLIPGCGLAPGLSNILVAQGTREVEGASEGHIYVGGLPQHPVPPMNYRLVFSVKGLLREYTMPARMIREGTVAAVAPFAEVFPVRFPKPVGLLEGFFTDGLGSSIYSLRRLLRSLDERTLRWPGHAEKMKFLIDSGFMSEETVRIEDLEFTPLQVSSGILYKTLTKGDSRDMTVMRVETIGVEAGERSIVNFDLLDYYDELNGITSMGRTTGFTAAIVTRMVGRGELGGTGVRPPETALDPRLVQKLLSELSLKGVQAKKSKRRAGPAPEK
jgi:lysine 6-dehydrogenase